MKTSAKSSLLAYCEAIKARDLESLASLFGDSVLLELPFVKPHRLFGSAEILAAHQQAFDNLEFVEMDLDEIAASGLFAVAEGELRYRWKTGEQQSRQLGAVAEMKGDVLRRISLYCDARNARLWSDTTIM